MSAKFSIVAKPARDLVEITLAGFFRLEDVARFDAARPAVYSQLRCAQGEHMTLCDATGMKIQSQEVVAAFSRAAADPRFRSRKLAFIVGSSLARMQTQRVAERESIAYFFDRAAAEAWLLAPESHSRAA